MVVVQVREETLDMAARGKELTARRGRKAAAVGASELTARRRRRRRRRKRRRSRRRLT